MPTLQQIRKQVVSVEVDMGGGDPVRVEMIPFAQGQREAEEWLKRLTDEEDNEQATALFYERFISTFPSWDLEDERKPVRETIDGVERQKTNPRTGKPQYEVIPLTIEGFKDADLDARLLAAFMVRAYEAHGEKKPKSGRR